MSRLENSWNTFLSRNTYLTYDVEANLVKEFKHTDEASNVPWYLLWNFSLKKKLRENHVKLSEISKDLKCYNTNFIEKRLVAYKSLFDGRDDNLDYPLDTEQRLAVVKDEKHNLVIAAAGSGKTSVIVSKIAYLTRREDAIKPERILALAFTKTAAKEMERKLKRYYNLDIKISTFHGFGRSIIIEQTKNPPKLMFDGANGEQEFGKYVKGLFDSCLQVTAFQEDLFEYLANYLDDEVEEATFSEKEEYYEYMRNKKYTTLTNCGVNSVAERKIANFLFKNRIKFVYELEVEWSDSDDVHKKYRPDFYLPEYDLYIEHWGLSRDNRVPEWFSMPTNRYLDKKEWAILQFKKYNKKLIESFSYEENEGILINNLQQNLSERSVNFQPMSYNELVEHTYEFKENTKEISNLIWSFIKLAKSNLLYPADIKKRFSSKDYTRKQILFAKLALVVYETYQNELKRKNCIDFNDMLNNAVEIAMQHKLEYLEKYDYILIDEFQDISNQRLELVKCFVNSGSRTKLLCVGDDWQSIFQFTGSEIKLFLNYPEIFPHPEISKLSVNYRCPEKIVHMSNRLISHNKHQISKKVISGSKKNGTIHLFELDNKSAYVEQRQRQHVFDKIKQLIKDGVKPEEILIIARFNKCLFDLKTFCSSRRIPVESGKQKGVRFYSAHKAKGTEANHVFILNVVSGIYGFPSEIQDASVLKMAKNNLNGNDFEEERRLFYVALTRSKSHLYIYTKASEQSIFLNEIRSYLDKNEIGYVKFDWKNQTKLVFNSSQSP